ncbi:MAG: OadG family protein [Candidatus Cloacimonetes bacterium]|nr:OadG family protein [Candidatus Cloacimonadota bacterium]
MRWIIALVATLLAASVSAVPSAEAAQQPEQPEVSTLADFAHQEIIPVATLFVLLELPAETPPQSILDELNIAPERLNAAVQAYYTNESLITIARDRGIPVKKLMVFLPGEDTDPNMTLGKLGLGKSDVDAAQTEFNAQKLTFIFGIIIIGMLVVFTSLMLTGFIISQLRRLNPQSRKKPTASAPTAAQRQEPEPDVSTNAIIAVITALHLHVREAEEQHKLMLTWRRTSLSMWRAGKLTMPNREYVLTRRK